MSDVGSRGELLAFAGLDGGSGELTWGQRFVWDILRSLAPANHYLNIRFRVHLPTAAIQERVLGALHTLIRRHEALRTRFPLGPGDEPRQQCDPAGDFPVTVREVEPGRVRRCAEQDEERLWREPFDHETEWPLRVSIVAAGGRPRQVVFVFSHLAVDAWGCAVLRREFLDLLNGASLEPPNATIPAQPGGVGPAVGWQPRARAAFEQSAPGRAANDLSLSYWRRVLQTAPQTAFPTLGEPAETPRYPGAGLHSVALAAAARALAAQYRVGPAAVVLAALAMIIGVRTSTDLVPLYLAAGNRFTPADAASVGTFYQAAPALIQLDTNSLAATIHNAHQASMLAYLRGHSDPRDVARLLRTTAMQRGVAIDLSTTVNVVPEPVLAPLPGERGRAEPTQSEVGELREMIASTRVSDLEGRDSEKLSLYLHVKSLRSQAILELFCDSRYLSAAQARQVLAGLELVLIEALETGDASRERVAELVGLEPLARPPRCVLIDQCWIDMDAVHRMVAELPDTLACAVFVVGSGDGRDRLMAYVVSARPTTPQRLHAAVVRRLDGRLTMAPQWYVICRSAPPQPQSRVDWEEVDWEGQVVLAQGSGRADEQGDAP